MRRIDHRDLISDHNEMRPTGVLLVFSALTLAACQAPPVPDVHSTDTLRVKRQFVAQLVALANPKTIEDPQAVEKSIRTTLKLTGTRSWKDACPAVPYSSPITHTGAFSDYIAGTDFWYRKLPIGIHILDAPYGPRQQWLPTFEYSQMIGTICNGNKPDLRDDIYTVRFGNLQSFVCFTDDDMKRYFSSFHFIMGTDGWHGYGRGYNNVASRIAIEFSFGGPTECAGGASVTEIIRDDWPKAR